nr:putative late blight resistance protein homolog R1B-14 [Ipomoea trifida]
MVADAVVGELVSRLAQVVEENASLIIGIKDQIDDLVSDLETFNAYLRQASKNQSAGDNDVLNDVVEKIRNVVIEAEDAIGKFTVQRKKYKDKGVLRYLETVAYYAKVNISAREIQNIRDKVQKIRQDNTVALQALIDDPNRGQPIMQRMAPVVEEEDVVGFDNEAKIIKGRLLETSADLTFISIKGMAGLGKTTLTKMVFKDRDLQFEFFTRLWVYVSRTFNRKQIFLDILSNFTKKTKEYHDMSDESLAERIREFLGGGKYFIVMDDVWSVRDWDCLKIAFPSNAKGSRVLVTTRHEKVALHVDSASNPHQLKFLNYEESWELLEKKVFRKEKCPHLLEAHGRQIALRCHGLPLAVVVIAGVLNKDSTHDNKPSSEHVRSFLSYCSKEVEIPNECLAAIPKSFPLLRVMDVEYLKFKILPKELYSLYHLRCLAVSTDLKLLPKLFNNLWNMQTLVFNSSQNSLEVKADIWSMSKLRHVHSNSSMVLPPPPKSSKNSASVSTDIKTLSTISPSSCTGDIFDKTPDLQKLGIRGNLAELMDVKQGGVSLFDNLQKLDRLENLKLINDALQSNKLRSFPRAEKFPRRLRKMTLSNTAFEWKDLSALGSLDELEVLKLEDNAFRGEFCDVRSVVFKQLQYFRIERTDLVSWTASKDSFPVLKCLFLRNCTKLDSVPVEFGGIESLKLLELYCTNKGAVISAQKIQELKKGVNGDTKKGGFQLSVYPPEQ